MHLLQWFGQKYEHYAYFDSAHNNGNSGWLLASEYDRHRKRGSTYQQLHKQIDLHSFDSGTKNIVVGESTTQLRTRPQREPQKWRYGDAMNPIFYSFIRSDVYQLDWLIKVWLHQSGSVSGQSTR